MSRFFASLPYWVRAPLAGLIAVIATYYGVCTLCLLVYNVVNPWTTGVQMQRRAEAWIAGTEYEKHYTPVPLAQIDDDLERAVVSAEDGAFFQHTGIDWSAIQEAVEDNLERGRVHRGGSTITQQLVKNLFMTTHSSFVRKAFEVPLTYLAELLLSKERILELYLNIIEWDGGVYGAEAAAQRYYGTSASSLSRYRAAALAACIPDPLNRSPQVMERYTGIILHRMDRAYGAPSSPVPAPVQAEESPDSSAAPERPRPTRMRLAPTDDLPAASGNDAPSPAQPDSIR